MLSLNTSPPQKNSTDSFATDRILMVTDHVLQDAGLSILASSVELQSGLHTQPQSQRVGQTHGPWSVGSHGGHPQVSAGARPLLLPGCQTKVSCVKIFKSQRREHWKCCGLLPPEWDSYSTIPPSAKSSPCWFSIFLSQEVLHAKDYYFLSSLSIL